MASPSRGDACASSSWSKGVARSRPRTATCISEDFLFRIDPGHRSPISPGTFWTNLQRVYHPAATRTATTVDQAWSWYREAGKPAQRTARVLVLFLLYVAIMWPLDHWVLDEEMIHPCRGRLSCSVDWIMTLSSVALGRVAQSGGVRCGHVVPPVDRLGDRLDRRLVRSGASRNIFASMAWARPRRPSLRS